MRQVAICPGVIVIGRAHEEEPNGYADFFTVDATVPLAPRWRQLQRVRGDDQKTATMWFGQMVACSADDLTVWVSEPGHDGFRGRVHEYRPTMKLVQSAAAVVANWTRVRTIEASTPAPGGYFGMALASGGDTLAVGSLRLDYVDLHRRNAATGRWAFEYTLKVAAADAQGFGQAVDVAPDGGTVLVGMPYVRDAAQRETGGGARMFVRRADDAWLPATTFIPAGQLGGEQCGAGQVYLVDDGGAKFGVLMSCLKAPGGIWFFPPDEPAQGQALQLTGQLASGVVVFGHHFSRASNYWLVAGAVLPTQIVTVFFRRSTGGGNYTQQGYLQDDEHDSAAFGVSNAISPDGLVIVTSFSGSYMTCLLTSGDCPGYGEETVAAPTSTPNPQQTTAPSNNRDGSTTTTTTTTTVLLMNDDNNMVVVDLGKGEVPLWLILVLVGGGALFCGCGLMLVLWVVFRVCRRPPSSNPSRGGAAELRGGRQSRSGTRRGRSRSRRSTSVPAPASSSHHYDELKLKPPATQYDPGPVPKRRSYQSTPNVPGGGRPPSSFSDYFPTPPPNYSGTEGAGAGGGFKCQFCDNVYPTESDVSIHMTKRHGV